MGLRALCGIAAFYRIAADPAALRRELALTQTLATVPDVLRAARLIGLKARHVARRGAKSLAAVPVPAILRTMDDRFVIYSGQTPDRLFRLIDPVTGAEQFLASGEVEAVVQPGVILVSRAIAGAGQDPRTIGFAWFWASIWRYRRPLAMVMLASLFIQSFALVTPLFFQVVIDKVLAHKAYSTLYVLVGGIALIGMFDVVLQYLRSYMLSHTTNRIDVELGQRLISHLFRLPLSYFETRPAGQTVARLRELESIRAFLTGQALFSALDVAFAAIFVAVLFLYSPLLTWIVVATIPIYAIIAVVMRPILQRKVEEKFYRGALSQQFLVESIVGVQTLKASAVEPLVRAEWEEKLAAYVRTAFDATIVATAGQNAIQYVSRAVTAALLLVGAGAVMDGALTVGELIAFNMIAAQLTQPIIRLSQFAQDFQQVKVSVERLGDILNAVPEAHETRHTHTTPPRGQIEFKGVTFRYRLGAPDVLKGIHLKIMPGEVIGIVGPSGSGKSTLTKLVQRLYQPQEGQVLLDEADLNHINPQWLRSHIGVVLQENLLFNRSIRDNIALAAPGLPDDQIIAISKLAGADEFISRMPEGYGTLIEERGANLSGGQRQRIAIARALATNPRILIFDEATSALDYESERIIQDNMRQIVSNRTVIIIAHRLAAVRGCTRIIAMDQGRIVEDGAPAELRQREDGLFHRLWVLQNETAQ
ncbi:peptidase C39 [Methylobacterium sp. Leaf113]|uniref:peptidase domain-containing ABC transporter n=1 Tax=Methylobacterium sp. Leaf113 TaxID=1736259 RepID=UPI000702162B|nr:type I secretion system permease/ATPase [Methylobacterium sp. Leaf113]KQP93249.1 peptidase C39 [Methylobacterium sp. Leaf113]